MKRMHPRSPRRPKFQRLDGRFVMDAEGLLQPAAEPLPTEEVVAEVAPDNKTDDVEGSPEDVIEFVATLEMVDGEEVESVRGGAIEDRIRTATGPSDESEDGEVSEEMLQTTGLPDGEVLADDGEAVPENGEVSEEIFQTTGMLSIEVASDTSGQFAALDVNRDGGVNSLDALNVINFLRRRSGAARESLAASEADSALDVDGDSEVTPLDALVILNNVRRETGRRLAVDGEGTNGNINIPILPGEDEVVGGSQSLTFADIGPYGVLTVEIVAGSVVVTGNSEVVASTIGEDGRIYAGDLELPVLLVTGADDKKELFQDFGSFAPDILVGSKSLTFADVGPYGVLTVEIAEDGSVVATGNSEAVAVTVGENGQVTVGDIPLHVFVVVGADGTNELIENFGAIWEPITSLTLENIGPYAYFDVMINEDGSLSAVGHKLESIPENTKPLQNWIKEAVEVSVGEDGRISFGDIALPVSLVTGENGVSELIQEFGIGDELPINSELAGAKLVTVVGADGQPIIVRVTEENGISALVGAEEKQVTLDEDSHVVVDGTRLPVLVIRSEDGAFLYPSGEIGEGFTVSWPVLVDEVFAEGEFVA